MVSAQTSFGNPGVGSTRGREIPGGLEGRLQIIPNQSGSGLDPLNRIARSENRDFVGSPEVGLPTGCGEISVTSPAALPGRQPSAHG